MDPITTEKRLQFPPLQHLRQVVSLLNELLPFCRVHPPYGFLVGVGGRRDLAGAKCESQVLLSSKEQRHQHGPRGRRLGAAAPTTGAASKNAHAGSTSPATACLETSAMGRSTSARRLALFGDHESFRVWMVVCEPGGVMMSHMGPLARLSFRSSVTSGQSSASASATYQAS